MIFSGHITLQKLIEEARKLSISESIKEELEKLKQERLIIIKGKLVIMKRNIISNPNHYKLIPTKYKFPTIEVTPEGIANFIITKEYEIFRCYINGEIQKLMKSDKLKPEYKELLELINKYEKKLKIDKGRRERRREREKQKK